jgi:hypothetical protein
VIVRGRLRPLLVVAGAMALMAATSTSAGTRPVPPRSDDPTEASALHLLQTAAWGSLMRPWTAVQRVVTLHGGLPRLAAMEVEHVPGRGSSLQVISADQRAVTSDAQDAALLRVLAGHYDVAFAGCETFAGRMTTVLEARRPGVTGAAAVAGRFWLDSVTGMVLRRDVLDDTGALVRTTTFDQLSVGAASQVVASSAPVNHLDETWLRSIEAAGWPVQRQLSAGLELFDARMHDAAAHQEVLQLSYSDGLSTVSLFVQPGEMSSEPSGTARPLDGGGTVWVTGGSPERMVWSADGHTWTLLSDAPESSVLAALQVLPHTPTAIDDSAPSRVWRGMAVVGGWLNPFA